MYACTHLANSASLLLPVSKSLGKTTRFVVDHAACPVLLVWPGSAPDVATIPPF